MLNVLFPLLRGMLFSLPAETAHHLTLRALGVAPWLVGRRPEKYALPSANVGGLTMAGPVGLAAGLDKDGIALDAWGRMGFGFIEVGTVTPRPQAGNPKPRLFRLKAERAIINRMGFNNAGVDALANRLRKHRELDRAVVPIGVNIGKNRDTPLEKAHEDYGICTRKVATLADYLVVNVSSPNTPGLRSLQDREPLQRILGAVRKNAPHLSVFLKLSPDLSEDALGDAIAVALENELTGLICTNTTLERPGTTGRLNQAGGLSGAPLTDIAKPKIKHVIEATRNRMAVIAVGGVDSVAKGVELIEAGADAIQLYSGFVYGGPALVSDLDIAARRALSHR